MHPVKKDLKYSVIATEDDLEMLVLDVHGKETLQTINYHLSPNGNVNQSKFSRANSSRQFAAEMPMPIMPYGILNCLQTQEVLHVKRYPKVPLLCLLSTDKPEEL